jgi:5-methyltetrahydropteroyltriglutamate--homocysteine methyltransferase
LLADNPECRFSGGQITFACSHSPEDTVTHPTVLPPFRADHVGSLLRSRKLIDARLACDQGKLPPADLQALEDEEIRAAVAMQERVGLRAVTDGEIRRFSWRDRFFERVDGFSKDRIASSFTFTDFSGERFPSYPVPTVVGKLRRRETLTAGDFAFLKPLTQQTAKATLPSPGTNHFFSGDKSLKGSPYSGRKSFFADVAKIYQQEIADLADAGCRYLQLDEVSIALLCDPRIQEIVRARGEDPQELITDYCAAINAAIAEKPSDFAVCVHLCRGNVGHGQASGGYDPVAERLFQELRVNGYFLEYDTERAGSFEVLRAVPKEKRVVLGMISTKLRELEDVDFIKRRTADAARFIDLAQLCLSPQCGFASGFQTDRFTMDDQERKLAHVVRIAREIWSDA